MPKVKVPWLCSRSQPGIKVIIRDFRGHLLHTVTFLVYLLIRRISDTPHPKANSESNQYGVSTDGLLRAQTINNKIDYPISVCFSRIEF